MHSVIFRYQLLYRGWLPIIPVIMTWRGWSLQSEAYLDSGAFHSIFKMSVAAELRLDVSRARERMFMVADNAEQGVWQLPIHYFSDLILGSLGAPGVARLEIRATVFSTFSEIGLMSEFALVASAKNSGSRIVFVKAWRKICSRSLAFPEGKRRMTGSSRTKR